MSKDDLIRIRHMLDAAQEAVSYLVGRKRAELDENRMLAHSLIRCITIIGEAAATGTAALDNPPLQAVRYGQVPYSSKRSSKTVSLPGGAKPWR